jgi:hypothetical protein
MNMTTVIRTCVCGEPLPRNAEGLQNGWYCCDEYYCSQECLNRSFEPINNHNDAGIAPITWEDHYTEDGDCYWSEWEDEEEL